MSAESAKEWFLYRRQKDGKIALVGNGEPLTLREATAMHLAHTGCVGERYNDYFIHKGRIH